MTNNSKSLIKWKNNYEKLINNQLILAELIIDKGINDKTCIPLYAKLCKDLYLKLEEEAMKIKQELQKFTQMKNNEEKTFTNDGNKDNNVININGPHKSHSFICLCLSLFEEKGFITCFNL